ncbi:MAG: Eco57I restriction-modification methylase domain-containing protein [Candidatus Thorarchaeota archaeon]
MRNGLDYFAWTILSKVSQRLEHQKQPNALVLKTELEATRIAALNWSLLSFQEKNLKESIKSRLLPFSELSYSAESESVAVRDVLNLANSVLQDFRDPDLASKLLQLTTDDIIELIEQIHSIGSHVSSYETQDVESRRILGAYYTPSAVVDYISEQTIGPVLDSLQSQIKKGRPDSPEQLIQLSTLDPACGTGAFLRSTLRVLARRISGLKDYSSEHVKIKSRLYKSFFDGLYGVDIDNAALQIAKTTLLFLAREMRFRPDRTALEKRMKRGNSLISSESNEHRINLDDFFINPQSRMPFDWQLEFPEILRREGSGFDFILMNPPYDRLKPNLAEFLRERLLTGSRDIDLSTFNKYRDRLAEDVLFFRNSGQYSFGNKYTINLYRLFVERALSLARIGGRFGFIVPSTLLGDLSSQYLRRELLTNHRIDLIDEYPESARIFPGVTQSVCIMVGEKGASTDTISVSFGLREVKPSNDTRRLKMRVNEVLRIMGKSLAIPRANHNSWNLIRHLHDHPKLKSLEWIVNRRGELDLTLDKGFIQNAATENRLVRGSSISRYALILDKASPAEYVDLASFKKMKRKSERIQHIKTLRLACQQVSNQAQRWRLKFALVPPNQVLANSCNYIALRDSVDSNLHYYLLGILNSDLLNWRFHISNTNNHVSNRELGLLPIVDPFSMDESARKIRNNLISLVRKQIKTEIDNSVQIESSVMNLYKINRGMAKDVLDSRSVPRDEIQKTLDGLS